MQHGQWKKKAAVRQALAKRDQIWDHLITIMDHKNSHSPRIFISVFADFLLLMVFWPRLETNMLCSSNLESHHSCGSRHQESQCLSCRGGRS